MEVEEEQSLLEAKWTAAARKAYHAEHPENCAGPDGSFPIKDASDVPDAWDLAGHAADPDAVRTKIKSIAKRLGFTDALPDTAKADSTAKESSQSASPFAPKARIATLTTRFLKNGAKSLNGRIYPRETVERLVQGAQLALSDPSAAMLTCYTSHDAADRQDPINLSGRITRVWQEGDDAYAKFDIPDTTSGRDMVALVSGGYLKTMSLRARNAELKLDKGYPLPIVTGSPQLEGIDFAPTPGLPDVALIQQVTVESAGDGGITLIETFALDSADVVLETAQETDTPMTTLKEQTSPDATEQAPPTSEMVDAIIALMDKRANAAITESLPMLKDNMSRAHDNIAEMLQMPCCKSGKTKEAGRAISKANSDKLGAAHDALAMALGTECRYDPDNDGDDDSTDDPSQNPDAQQDSDQGMNNNEGETQNMTKEEALKLLEAEGFTVQAPPTPEEKMQAELDKKIAEHLAAFETRLTEALAKAVPAAQTQTATPQRKTLVEGANAGKTSAPANPNIYRHGDYLKEKLSAASWPELADRSRPLPEGISAKYVIKEFSELLAGVIEENYV